MEKSNDSFVLDLIIRMIEVADSTDMDNKKESSDKKGTSLLILIIEAQVVKKIMVKLGRISPLDIKEGIRDR